MRIKKTISKKKCGVFILGRCTRSLPILLDHPSILQQTIQAFFKKEDFCHTTSLGNKHPHFHLLLWRKPRNPHLLQTNPSMKKSLDLCWKRSSAKSLRNREKIFDWGEKKPNWTEKPKSKPSWRGTSTPTWKKRVIQAKQHSLLPHPQHVLYLLPLSILQHPIRKSSRDSPLRQPFQILQAVIGNLQFYKGHIATRTTEHPLVLLTWTLPKCVCFNNIFVRIQD